MGSFTARLQGGLEVCLEDHGEQKLKWQETTERGRRRRYGRLAYEALLPGGNQNTGPAVVDFTDCLAERHASGPAELGSGEVNRRGTRTNEKILNEI